MVIESFKLQITSEELSDIIIRQAWGLIETFECKDGSIFLSGIQPNGKFFWAEVAVRTESGRILFEVIDASVDGVWLGFQEYGISLTMDNMLKRYFPNASGGGRTVSIVPFADIVEWLTRLCKMQEISLPEPVVSLTESGLAISCET